MKTVTVVGTQWGDEGKGKVTDYLSEQADVVVRFQGGNNAGHTIKFDGMTFALHLIPSGVFRTKCINVLASGMVIDPEAFLQEKTMLEKANILTTNIEISDRAHVVMPFHLALDVMHESLKKQKVGTTAKGIGPTYTDKFARQGLRMIDFIDRDRFKAYLEEHVPYVNTILQAFKHPTFDKDLIFEKYRPIARLIKPHVKNTMMTLNEALKLDKKILFEGAQGTMLCIDHGSYPFVTSSSPTAASVPLSAGIPPQAIKQVVGVTKAYTTRVGEGFFPTEFTGELADTIRINGREFGTTTGRPRRIGWLDLVVLKHAKRLNGLTHLAIMLLDVLKDVETLKLCIAYELDKQIIDYIPAAITDFERCKPVFIEMPGFSEDISQINTFDALPKNARQYLKKIEEITEVKLGLISVGPDRSQTMILEDFYR